MAKDVNVQGYIPKSKVQSESFHLGVGGSLYFFIFPPSRCVAGTGLERGRSSEGKAENRRSISTANPDPAPSPCRINCSEKLSK